MATSTATSTGDARSVRQPARVGHMGSVTFLVETVAGKHLEISAFPMLPLVVIAECTRSVQMARTAARTLPALSAPLCDLDIATLLVTTAVPQNSVTSVQLIRTTVVKSRQTAHLACIATAMEGVIIASWSRRLHAMCRHPQRQYRHAVGQISCNDAQETRTSVVRRTKTVPTGHFATIKGVATHVLNSPQLRRSVSGFAPSMSSMDQPVQQLTMSAARLNCGRCVARRHARSAQRFWHGNYWSAWELLWPPLV